MKIFLLNSIMATLLLSAFIANSLAAGVEDDATVSGMPVPVGLVSVFRSQVGMAARRSGPGARYLSSGGTSSYNCNNTVAGGERIIRYPFTAPDSRFLDSVRVWGVKGTNTQNLTLAAFRSCMSQAQVSPTTQVLGANTITTTSGEFVSTVDLNHESPNNLDCKYWLEVQFGSPAEACTLNHTDFRIYKMRVESMAPDLIFQDRFSNDAFN